jgi:hypothetical protein
MTARPRLPEGFELPEEVNGWQYDPDAGYNAHVWVSEDETTALGVFASTGKVYAKVLDERVSGFNRSEYLVEESLEDCDPLSQMERQTVVDVVDDAVAWMESTAPDESTHPLVIELVLVALPGYALTVCYVDQRDTTIYYRRVDAADSIPRDVVPEDATPATFPYLVVHVWNGSGNSTVSLAPWERAHDHAMREVIETLDACALDVALAMARAHARENVDGDSGRATTGPPDIERSAEVHH